MTNMYNNRDTPATVEHARSIIRKLESKKVSKLDLEIQSRGRTEAVKAIKKGGSVRMKDASNPGGIFRLRDGK